ncbi:hypothetical protein GcM1_226101 [Golovinomyces cichoracearum]|uniref:Uncharacterized protein n=1 Tax=Golovinomyces cichoracearum TaxID=62708 RepID=A0A420IQ05_9PEZI|nr:hypothetical protein GcM1_226101 [Golovinomyces cichoracearum]
MNIILRLRGKDIARIRINLTKPLHQVSLHSLSPREVTKWTLTKLPSSNSQKKKFFVTNIIYAFTAVNKVTASGNVIENRLAILKSFIVTPAAVMKLGVTVADFKRPDPILITGTMIDSHGLKELKEIGEDLQASEQDLTAVDSIIEVTRDLSRP